MLILVFTNTIHYYFRVTLNEVENNIKYVTNKNQTSICMFILEHRIWFKIITIDDICEKLQDT